MSLDQEDVDGSSKELESEQGEQSVVDDWPEPHRLSSMLRIKPLTESSISYFEFLEGLADNPERADSAAAVLFKAIIAMEAEDPAQEPDPERRQYLEMLQANRIPSLQAFKHVAGSQRFARQPLSFLVSAAAGGAQREQMLIFDGGPGSGKDFFKDGIVRALEAYTQTQMVYAVEGCPEHENPVNLLKLLSKEQIEALQGELGIADLQKIVKLACDPCQRCYELVMGTVLEPKGSPSFDDVKVVPMRLSAMSCGISDWQPGGQVPLSSALSKGNRGFVSLPDAFIKRTIRPGETDERLLLLDATQYRRLPGVVDEIGNVRAASPLDVVILATTNERALRVFLRGDKEEGVSAVTPDANAFTSRARIMRLPYNTVRIEEVRVYREALARFSKRCRFDPLVLHVLATAAVLSRFPKPRKKGQFVHPLDVMAVYQGENIEPTIRPATEFDPIWGTTGSGSSPRAGSGWGAPAHRPSTTTAEPEEELPPLPTDMKITAGLLFEFADPKEGHIGLDMRTMLGFVSSLNQIGLRKPGEVQCVNSLEVLQILRVSIADRVKMTQDNTAEQQEMYERLLKWLGGPLTSGQTTTDKPPLIEAEFRRMLRNLLVQVYAPDYEARAAKLYDDYKRHSEAAFQGKPTVKDPNMGQVPVNTALLDELDRYRLGKSKGTSLSDEDKQFRGELDARISGLREQYKRQNGTTRGFEITWETIPEIAQAIRAKLDDEISTLMEKVISEEVESDLEELEQQQKQRAHDALLEMGFCDECLKPILEYAKKTKVWSFKLY